MKYYQQRGMTLIEIMISLLIGTFLIGGIIQIFLTTNQTYRTQENLSRMQENGRFAMEFLTKDIRMAGYNGCGTKNATLANTLNNSATSWEINFNQPIQGFNDVASTLSIFNRAPIAGTDAITILSANGDDACVIASHNPTAASVHCEDNHDLKQGEILLISNCSHAAVFQMSNVNNNNTISVVDHNTGSGTNPGNCTKGLGVPVPSPCTANGTSYEFEDGSIRRQKAIGYFIATGVNAQPALFRATLNSASEITAGNARVISNELIEGVENMQILYGVDGIDSDNSVDYYVSANQVTDMNKVVSIRISLLIRSIDGNVTSTPRAYTYNGATTTPTDNRLRRVFSSTIAVRNRLP